MRHPKKYYYETVLRLTLLASILRQTNIHPFSSHNHIAKHTEPNSSTKSYLDEIALFGPSLSYLIAPASLLVQTPTQKDILTLLHDNSFSKEDIEMEIDLQTILQQDIDLGISPSSTSHLQNRSKQADFYMESQKNADILATTVLFEQNRIPDGCKLIVEEDTGEFFIMLMPNESNKTEPAQSGLNASAFAANLRLNSTTNATPEFLNQLSINQELEKLNENLNMNSTSLDDTLTNLDSENLLDETWINQLLDDNNNSTELIYDQIKINDDKMLSKLNDNQTFVLSPLLVQNNYLTNDTLYNDTTQFENMLDQAIMAHDKEETKNQSDLRAKDLEISSLIGLMDNNQKLNQINATFKSLGVSNHNGSINMNNHKAKNVKDVLIDNLNLKKEVIENDTDLSLKAYTPVKYNASSSTSLSSIQSSALSGLVHNHTYLSTSNSEEDSLINHPYSYKNKLKKMLKSSNKSDGERNEKHASRDQQLLRENNIPLSLSQIVETSADEFNDLIRDKSLNSDQILIAKDIRRRGKNKVAAQICRKRKLDSIDSLKESVAKLELKKSVLCAENANLHKEIKEATAKFNKLYQDAIGNSFNATDPTMITINNLKEQLNTKEVQISEIRSYETEESDPRDFDGSFEDDSDDEEDDDSDLYEDDDKDSNISFETQDPGLKKKIRRF